MKCPYCGREMEQGYLHGHPQTIWSPKKTRFTTLLGEGDIPILRGLLTSKTPANACRVCHKIILDYAEE